MIRAIPRDCRGAGPRPRARSAGVGSLVGGKASLAAGTSEPRALLQLGGPSAPRQTLCRLPLDTIPLYLPSSGTRARFRSSLWRSPPAMIYPSSRPVWYLLKCAG